MYLADFVIIPDSSADMTSELRERFGIPAIVRGTLYYPDGSQHLANSDWEDFTPDEYYASMKGRNILYKTATPPVGETMNVYESFLKEGKDILSISLSSAISGTYQGFVSVANELMEKYPERKIICVDSLRYASAEALLVTKACEKRDSGATIEETAEYLNEIKHCIHQMGPLDDLFFCVKTGRISNFKAIFGTLVGVNTLGEFAPEGIAAVIGKTKGRNDAINATVEYTKAMIKNPEEQILFVAHSAREESAKLLAQKLREELNPKDIIINPIGASCGSSIGPGLCAVYFLGDPISENNTVEKAALAKVLADMKRQKITKGD